MTLRKLNFFFTILLLATKKRKSQIEYSEITSEIEVVLSKLQSFRFIRGYKIDKERQKAIIFLACDSTISSSIMNVQIISKPSYRRTISLEKIKQFLRTYPTTLAFVRTSHGILSFQESEEKKCGGEWLVILS